MLLRRMYLRENEKAPGIRCSTALLHYPDPQSHNLIWQQPRPHQSPKDPNWALE